MDSKIKLAMKAVFDYLSVTDKPQKSDVIFIAVSFSVNPPKKAAELYLKGFSKKIFIVGKHGTFSDASWKKSPAKTYKNELIRLGVPGNDIVARSLAPNTYLEAVKSIPLMRRQGINPKKVIVIDRPEHQRREWATFQKVWPAIKFINCPCDEPLVYSQKILDILIAETKRLEAYAVKGDLVRQKVPIKVKSAVKFLEDKVRTKY